MTKICLSTALLTCTILQLCAAAAGPEGDHSVHAVAGPRQEVPSPSTVPPMPVAEINARNRKEVLNELARALQSQYVIPDTAKKLAETVRAKQASNAYKKSRPHPSWPAHSPTICTRWRTTGTCVLGLASRPFRKAPRARPRKKS